MSEMSINDENAHMQDQGPNASIRFQASDNYEVDENGDITLCLKLDKDTVECCVCYCPMTGSIYRCRSQSGVVHNICFNCEWQIRRLKETNGHSKKPRCPLCKTEGTFLRNVALERQLNDLCNTCTNHSQGCARKFYIWCGEEKKEHEQECSYAQVHCPACSMTINGCSDIHRHLNEDCQCGPFQALQQFVDMKQPKIQFSSHQNSYIYNEQHNYIILFIWKDTYFELMAINTNGNFPDCRKQVTLNVVKTQDWNNYMLDLRSRIYPERFYVPQRHQMGLNLRNFQLVGAKATEEMPRVQFFAGPIEGQISFTCRFSTFTETLSKGCNLDCRDYFGKWYESEIISIVKENPFGTQHTGHERTRVHVHYLGYSSSYDEWFDLGMDTSRIAPKGTFTVGPNLRTRRRAHHAMNNCPQAMAHMQRRRNNQI